MNDFYEIMIAAPPLDKKTPDGPRTYGVLSFLASNVWKFHGTSFLPVNMQFSAKGIGNV